MTSYIGPELPPHLRKQSDNSDDEATENNKSEDNEKEGVIGPLLPPALKRKEESSSLDDGKRTGSSHSSEESEPESDEDASYGPALPPGFQIKRTEQRGSEGCSTIMGPAIPHSLRTELSDRTRTSDSSRTLNSDSESDDSVIGPVPASSEADYEAYLRDQVEARAKSMKDQLTKKVSTVHYFCSKVARL